MNAIMLLCSFTSITSVLFATAWAKDSKMLTHLTERVRSTLRFMYDAAPALFHYTILATILYGLKLMKVLNAHRWGPSIILTLPCFMFCKIWRKPLKLSRLMRRRRIPYVEECRIVIEHYIHSSKKPHVSPQTPLIQLTEYRGPSIVDILPQEIIDRIIDCLAPDVRLLFCPSRSERICQTRQGLAMPNLTIPDFTFVSCALVCKAFQHRSQYHMWRSLHIRSAPRLNNVVTSLNQMGMGYNISRRTLAGKMGLMQDYPHFACAVKHVQLCLSPSKTDLDRGVEQTDAKALLQTIKEAGATIDSLCLQMRNSLEHDGEDLLDLLVGPHLDPFSVTALHLRDAGQVPLSLLGEFSSLRSLSLARVERANGHPISISIPNDDNPAISRHLPKIEALVIGADSMVFALRMIGMVSGVDGGFIKAHAAILDLSRLTHLDLIYTDLHPLLESGLEEVTTLLDIVGRTVTHLRYTFDQFCMGGPDLNYANLRQTPNLRTLDVVFSCEWPCTALTPHAGEMSISVGSLSAFLSNLAPGTLETLNITFAHLLCRDARYPPKSILSMQWHRLDAELRRIYGINTSDRRLTVNIHINYMGAQPDVTPIQMSSTRGGIGIAPIYAKWRSMTKAACHQLFEVELPKQFVLSSACPGIRLSVSHSTGTIDEFIDILTDLSSRGISA